jgi:ethanolamine utilization protein EutN
MQLGKVIGRVWSTVKNPNLEGQRLLLVQPVTHRGEPVGRAIVCTDATNSAGAGELIYWVRGREAAHAFRPAEVTSDSTIVAIVDELHLEEAREEC